MLNYQGHFCAFVLLLVYFSESVLSDCDNGLWVEFIHFSLFYFNLANIRQCDVFRSSQTHVWGGSCVLSSRLMMPSLCSSSV